MSNCYCIPVNDYLNIRFVEKRKTLLHLGRETESGGYVCYSFYTNFHSF